VAQGSDAISASETRSSALEVVGRLGSTGGAPPEAWRPSGSGKQAGEDGRGETDCEMGKAGEGGKFLERKTRTSPTEETCGLDQSDGVRKVHSLIDKVYKRKNLEIAWERVTDPIFQEIFRYFD
jgi:hypothetical protein